MEKGDKGRTIRMILIIRTNKESLHDLEFVKPIEKILSERGFKFFVKHYSKVNKADLKKAEKVIICGTSLKDGEYLYPKNFEYFKWITTFQKPIFGICAGAQILAVLHGQKLFACEEIGNIFVIFKKEFLGCEMKMEVYALHQMSFNAPKDKFIEFVKSKKCVHTIKVINKPFYGVLFHPEVKNHKIIENFCES